jgi:uncharacterized protein YvpB
LVTILVATVAVAGASIGGTGSHSRPSTPTTPVIQVLAGSRTVLSVPLAEATPRRLASLLSSALPAEGRVQRGRAQLVVRYDADATRQAALRLRRTGGRVQAARETIAAETPAPVLKQAQRNTCESAALQILLATTGRDVGQRRLQAAFPRSGAPDPTGLGTTDMAWGDPDVGYVGRPDGGGTAGGFGIYPGPVKRTARRYGVQLTDLTGQSPQAVYRRLRRGDAVMAWVGLSAGPYGTWRTPRGQQIKVNYGEHTVVLHGINADGSVDVSNPLRGTSEEWPREQFESMWRLLGNRALSI